MSKVINDLFSASESFKDYRCYSLSLHSIRPSSLNVVVLVMPYDSSLMAFTESGILSSLNIFMVLFSWRAFAIIFMKSLNLGV